MSKVVLFLNGEKPLDIPDVQKYSAIYCTDGAYHFLTDCEITPDLIIGDFDSIEKLPIDIPHIHTPDQNYTDFEKAIELIIQQGHKEIDVYAANGLEQDHFLGNMCCALKYKKKIKIRFYDDKQSYYFIKKNTTLTNVINKIISLFPFPIAKNITTKGLKYPLKKSTLNMMKNKIGTRNKAVTNNINITFSKGNLLIFIENK